MDGGAPVWLGPLFTGVFVLAAAVIALVSLYFSDRRKLRREDQRQWDAQLTTAYLAIINKTHEVGQVLAERAPTSGTRGDRVADVVVDAMRELQEQRLRLELVTKERVINATEDIASFLVNIYTEEFTARHRGEGLGPPWTKTKINELGELEQALRDEVRRALRIPKR